MLADWKKDTVILEKQLAIFSGGWIHISCSNDYLGQLKSVCGRDRPILGLVDYCTLSDVVSTEWSEFACLSYQMKWSESIK